MATDEEAPLDRDALDALSSERWALLVEGILLLLLDEEPLAYRRVIEGLKRPGLVGPAMRFARAVSRDPAGTVVLGDILPLEESLDWASGVGADFATIP